MIYPVLTYSRNLGDFSTDLEKLQKCGLKAIRLIYKGKTEVEFNQRISEIQSLLEEKEIEIDIIIDLPGNKPTVGNLSNRLNVIAETNYKLVDQETESSLGCIPTVNFFSHKGFLSLKSGDIISIADDELNLLVKVVQKEYVLCKAINSFDLSSNRSISVKNNPFIFEANSDRDICFVKNLTFTKSNIKLLVSFTKSAKDIMRIKDLQPKIDVIAKIENVLDDKELREILTCCETVLLGRGDLSTAHKPSEIFKFQKHLIDLCNKQKKKLIIGTGLLNGIIDKEAPSIAEIMDYGYLRSMDIEAFLISGSMANKQIIETLKFMNDFQ